MRIKNKKTGEIVEITDTKQLAKYGLSIPKAKTGKIIKGKKANNTYNNNYEDIFNNRNPNQISFIPRDEGQEPNVTDLYEPPQSYIQGMNSMRPQQESMTIPTLSELQPNLSLNQNPYTPETIKNYSEKPISKPTFKPSPNLYPVTTNKYFDRALRYNQNATNFAFDAINNLATGEKSNRSNVSYNGNLGIPQQNIDINYNKVNSPKTEKYFAQSGIQLPENENSMINMLNFKVRPQENSYVMPPLDIQQIKKNGGNIQKAKFGFTPRDEGNEPILNETSQFYNPNGQFNNFNLGTGDNSPVYEAPPSINMIKDKNAFNMSDVNSSDVGYNTLNFIGAGVNNTLAGINMGKGILDMVGNNRQNKMEQKRNAEQFTQSVFNSEEFSTPYESRGYGFQGRNALAENGMQIKDLGGYGQPNIEAEKGEMVKTPEGFAQTLQGKTHEEGGIPLNLQPETKIFSDHLKDPITKKTYSKLAKPFETKKDFDRMNSKKGDDIQKKTSELMISFKNQKSDEIFAQQEEDKIFGRHGAKIQLETIQNQQPMAKYGMELPKAQGGEYVPKEAFEIVKNFQDSPTYKYINDAKNLTEGKKRLKEQLELNKSLTPEISKKIDASKSFQELNPIAGVLQQGTYNLHPEAASHYGLNIAPTRKGLQYLVDKKIVNPQEYPSFFKNGKPIIGSMKDYPDTKEAQKLKSIIESKVKGTDIEKEYAKTNYQDTEWYYRNPEFKDFKFKSKGDYDNYTEQNKTNKFGDYFFSGTEGLYLKPSYPQDPQINQQTPQDTKIEYRDRIKNQYLQPNIEANMNIPAYLPNNYGRSPLNFYDLNPEFIDPRYLDIQPQLNQVSRGQRAFQNNLGSRTSSDMSNLLQSQVNAYNQNQNIYGQKYNYDRQQDATAQQFNAQAVMNTDKYNQSAWYNQLEDPIRRRESILDTQIRTDDQANIENASNATAFYNNLDYIQNEVPYYNKLNKDQIVEALDLYVKQQDPYKTTKKTITKKTKNGTEKTEIAKYGGKVKIKPKLKRNNKFK